MREYLTIVLCVFGCLAGSTAFAQPQKFTTDPSLLKFLEELAEATYQFNVGNPRPYLALLSPSDQLTLMGAGGGMEKGIAQIRPRLEFLTKRRTEGAGFQENRAEIEYVSILALGDLAYTVQIERRRLAGTSQATPTVSALRATHVLRKESGQWKLLHRQADPLTEVTVPGLPAPPTR